MKCTDAERDLPLCRHGNVQARIRPHSSGGRIRELLLCHRPDLLFPPLSRGRCTAAYNRGCHQRPSRQHRAFCPFRDSPSLQDSPCQSRNIQSIRGSYEPLSDAVRFGMYTALRRHRRTSCDALKVPFHSSSFRSRKDRACRMSRSRLTEIFSYMQGTVPSTDCRAH